MSASVHEEELSGNARDGTHGGKRRYKALSAERLAEIGRKAGVKSGQARRKKSAAKLSD